MSRYTLPSGKATIEKELESPLSTTEFTYQQKGKTKAFRESMVENLIMQERIKKIEKDLIDSKRKFSELSAFRSQIEIETLKDLKVAFSFKGHLENSIQPEELTDYIEKLEKKNEN